MDEREQILRIAYSVLPLDDGHDSYEQFIADFSEEELNQIVKFSEEITKLFKTSMQSEIDRLKSNQCTGHFREGCNYLSSCNTICNKCGEIHNADTGMLFIQQHSGKGRQATNAEEQKVWYALKDGTRVFLNLHLTPPNIKELK